MYVRIHSVAFPKSQQFSLSVKAESLCVNVTGLQIAVFWKSLLMYVPIHSVAFPKSQQFSLSVKAESLCVNVTGLQIAVF